ncbi:MAG: ATP-binding protein, partial [Phyllobacteriaceae bacterium]|nr:ATP-binding protein [Phyllobacteriaceae bacterium]
QILTNLFVNAVTHAFTDGRSGVMRIEARSLGEDRVGISFSDDGVGMDAETARRAFEPLFTTRRGKGGSGLGLHIVRTLVVNRMGGRIRIDTAPGEGCRFEISVPREAPEDQTGSRDREEG